MVSLFAVSEEARSYLQTSGGCVFEVLYIADALSAPKRSTPRFPSKAVITHHNLGAVRDFDWSIWSYLEEFGILCRTRNNYSCCDVKDLPYPVPRKGRRKK